MFESGESGFIFPFRYVWFAEADEIASVEVLFSVPKKFHKGPTNATSCAAAPRRPTACKSRFCTTAGRSIWIWR